MAIDFGDMGRPFLKTFLDFEIEISNLNKNLKKDS
jgi:hypothetical protein